MSTTVNINEAPEGYMAVANPEQVCRPCTFRGHACTGINCRAVDRADRSEVYFIPRVPQAEWEQLPETKALRLEIADLRLLLNLYAPYGVGPF